MTFTTQHSPQNIPTPLRVGRTVVDVPFAALTVGVWTVCSALSMIVVAPLPLQWLRSWFESPWLQYSPCCCKRDCFSFLSEIAAAWNRMMPMRTSWSLAIDTSRRKWMLPSSFPGCSDDSQTCCSTVLVRTKGLG